MAEGRYHTQSNTKVSMQAPTMYTTQSHPTTANNSTHSYNSHQYHCNSKQYHCNEQHCHCKSRACQCNEQPYQFNEQPYQYIKQPYQYNAKHCPCSMCQEHHQKHKSYQVQDVGFPIHDPDTQSRFRFHDMAHGNSLTKFRPPEYNSNRMIRQPIQASQTNNDMVPKDQWERYGDRQMVSTNTPMQHRMYWYGY